MPETNKPEAYSARAKYGQKWEETKAAVKEKTPDKPKPKKTPAKRKTKAKSKPITTPRKKAQAKPPVTKPTAADKALEEAKELRAEQQKNADLHVPATVDRVVEGEKGEVRISTAGGRVFVKGDATFDQDGFVTLRQAADAAFQAVS